MKTFRPLSLLLFLPLLAHTASAQSEPLKAFPAAGEGMKRHVLKLEPEADESALKVELIVGKTVETDGVNRHFFGGTIERGPVEGWGYHSYRVRDLGPMAGTLVAPPPGSEKAETFVSLGGEPYLIRYNSKLPVVVYVPEGAEVRFRIWRAEGEGTAVPEG